jgi:urate oxidase/2-oxo-4-hydroxy-4-carboxy-5-ureidoimidazoline decarboxylase
MRQFMSGCKRNYYGKGDVIVYRLQRNGKTPSGKSPVLGVNVAMMIYGDAFWRTYETGDNTGLIATDSMKNFIQRETMNFAGSDLESYAMFLVTRFLETYPQTEGAQLTATEIPYRGGEDGSVAFVPSGPERATARIELRRAGKSLEIAELRSGIEHFRLLRLGGSAFHGFLRDQYTTLPDNYNRPLHMWLDLDWLYTEPEAAFSDGAITSRVRSMVHESFHAFESGSIQQIIYRLGKTILAELTQIAEVNLEANNHTWAAVVEHSESLGVYVPAPPPYGCIGLTLRR